MGTQVDLDCLWQAASSGPTKHQDGRLWKLVGFLTSRFRVFRGLGF